MRIGTHSGTFHCDEALAVYMLRLLPAYAQADLTRTRDPAVLDACDIVVDVGGKYDGTKYFDHHQRGFEEVFSSQHKTKLSSAGLVYKHFGQEIIRALAASTPAATSDNKKLKLGISLDEETTALVHRKVYDDFIEGIDAQDNGISPYPDPAAKLAFKPALSLPGMVAHLNPDWNELADDSERDKRFSTASQLVGTYFQARVLHTLNSWLPARSLCRDAVTKALSSSGTSDALSASAAAQTLLFGEDEFLPWKEHLFDVEAALGKEGQIKYVVYLDGSWRIQAVPVGPGSFASRLALPEAWRGLRDSQLDAKLQQENVCSAATSGAVFVHASGFIGGHSSRSGALAMVEAALARA
ncbi:hypothetical protein PYCC9005_002421 [Savitreella phatthalungensis]